MEQLIRFDQQLLLALNGSDSLYWDNFFMLVTKTLPWLPMAALLLYIIARSGDARRLLLFIVSMALVIFIADRFSSGFCKPFFHRFRPTHEPSLEGLVDIVGTYTGGLYGFISSHAANTFAVATFVSLVFKERRMTLTLIAWACLSSYSRIYLGLHYPGDILFGALWGFFTGFACYWLYKALLPLFSHQAPASNPVSAQSSFLMPLAFLLTCGTLLILAFFTS